MIYEWFFPLRGVSGLGALNVLRYVPFRAVMAMLTSLVLTFWLYPWFIRTLQERQVGQVIRKDGPESHLSKAGTPTMGGALILLVLALSSLLWADPRNLMVWLVMAITVGFGLVGYIDDSAKIRRRNTTGLSAGGKLLLQFSMAFVACSLLWWGDSQWLWEPLRVELPSDWAGMRNRLALPFVAFERFPMTMPAWLYVPFAAVVIVGTSNAVNLADGLDGLAIGPVLISSGTYLILAYIAGATLFGYPLAEYLDIPALGSARELSVFCGALVGAGVGFLWFNTYPAQVFMGDVGSLALGGALGALAVMTKNEFVSIILGGVFVAEAVSVIVQVTAFRFTGKRVFLMAPIHHHYEKLGWPEPKVIVRFWIVSVMLALVSLAQLKLR